MVRWLGRILAALTLLIAALVLLATYLPGNWLADRLASLATSRLDAHVAMKDVEIRPFGPLLQVDVSSMSIEPDQGAAMLYLDSMQVSVRWLDLLRGHPSVDRLSLAGADLQLHDEPNRPDNLQSLLEHLVDEGSVVRRLVDSLSDLQIRDILIDSMTLHSGRDEVSQSVSLRISGAASTDNSGNGTRLQIDGELLGRTLLMSADLPSLHYMTRGFPKGAGAEGVKLDVELGDSHLLLEGSIGKPARLSDVSLGYSMNIASVRDWQLIVPASFADLSPLTVSGDVLRDEAEWQLNEFALQWGQSDLVGEARLDTSSKPITVKAQLSSEELHGEDLRFLSSEQALPAEFSLMALAGEGSAFGSLMRYLGSADKPLVGSVSYRADRVVAETWPVSMFDVQAEMVDDRLMLAIDRMNLGSGVLEGVVDTRSTGTQTETSLNLYLKRFELAADSSSSGKPGSLAVYLDVQLSQQGTDEAPRVKDGQLLALVAAGDASLVLSRFMNGNGLSLLDSAAESIDPASVKCSFVDLQLSAENIDIATLVISTEDAIVLGDGSLSLSDHALDVSMESHATGKNTASAWQVQGPLTAPVGASASPVLGRDTAAVVLADIVAPAARLMPFLDPRGEAMYSAYCSGMANALQGEQ
ncbi:AsmA family protein [Granulosicoccus sp. 3-233]|uniref:AsmA family protein n=1 Tax=Granulosicoccus sp. 3-233 TaxID=3417969 RepID=UPI003D334A68